MKPTTILCADTDIGVRKLLQYGLGGYGYHVITAASEQQLSTLLTQRTPDLILLDLDLGARLNGLEVCRSLRERYIAPIFLLAASQDKNPKILALNLGADEYFVKPVDVEELEAQIRATLRRVAVRDAGTPSAELGVNGLAINLTKRRVSVDGQDVHLTRNEYAILRMLVVNSGRVLSCEVLLGELARDRRTRPEHYVRVYVNMLRRKLHDDARTPRYIFTETGVGYRFIDIPAHSH